MSFSLVLPSFHSSLIHYFTDLEAELQQANVNKSWFVRGSCRFDSSPFGPQPYRLYRAILLFWPDLPKTPAAGGERSQRGPPAYLHNSVSTRTLLDFGTQVRHREIYLKLT